MILERTVNHDTSGSCSELEVWLKKHNVSVYLAPGKWNEDKGQCKGWKPLQSIVKTFVPGLGEQY